MSIAGHYFTIVPSQAHSLRPRAAPAAEPWSTLLTDERVGAVRLRGWLRAEPGSRTCLVVVHGLGGSTEAHYCVDAAHAAARAGVSCLRLGLRGADREGEDFYHGGLAADLEAAAASEALAQYERLVFVGYSLGGHVTLRFALGVQDPRVRAVAAVCAPLDLELSAQAIDRKRAFLYRRHVLAGLNDIYRAVARKREVPTPLARVLQARTIREWDSLTVVPRYGFGTVERYYQQMSAGPRLSELRVPALLVQSLNDPMVPPWTYEPHLVRALPRLRVERLHEGGHVGFPRNVRLGTGERGRLEDLLLQTLLAA